MTVRVLDDATYAESFSIDDPAKYEDVTLDAPKHAVLELPTPTSVLAIRDVPGFQFKGFRIRAPEPRAAALQGLLVVTGHTPGVVLEGLDFEIKGGTAIKPTTRNLAGEKPVLAQKNTIRRGAARIYVLGSTGVCLWTNSIADCVQGIRVQGLVANVHLSANLILKRISASVEINNLDPQSKGVLLANNTLYNSQALIRIWDDDALEDFGAGRQVELRNNLLFGADFADILLIHHGSPADSKHLSTLWDFKCNWRELAGAHPGNATPLAARDRKLESVKFVSRDPSSPDFLRPPPDSPLANDGAGKDDPSLPAYIGAVPPKGVELWDWDKTWKLRARKVEPEESKPGKDSANPPGDKGKP